MTGANIDEADFRGAKGLDAVKGMSETREQGDGAFGPLARPSHLIPSCSTASTEQGHTPPFPLSPSPAIPRAPEVAQAHLMTDYSLKALADGTILSPFSRLRHLLDGNRARTKPHHRSHARRTARNHAAVHRREDARGRKPVCQVPAHQGVGGAAPGHRRLDLPPLRRHHRCRYGSAALQRFARRLLYAAYPAVGRKQVPPGERAALLICNPYYQAYFGAAIATGAEPYFLNATAETGHLPDLEALARNEPLLRRTAALFLCSPANPQGAVASEAYIRRAISLARSYDFMLFLDECYSEIYADAPPTGGLEVAAKTDERFRNVIVFNSLSKRSNVPGLRSGFVAGDARFMATLFEVKISSARRCLAQPSMPLLPSGRKTPRRDEPHRLSRQVRHRRRDTGLSFWIHPSPRRLLPVARCFELGRRVKSYGNLMETFRRQGHTWCLSGPG